MLILGGLWWFVFFAGTAPLHAVRKRRKLLVRNYFFFFAAGFFAAGFFFGPRPLKVNSAIPLLSSSPRPTFTILLNCARAAAARGRLSFCSLASFRAMPLSLAACAALKKQL